MWQNLSENSLDILWVEKTGGGIRLSCTGDRRIRGGKEEHYRCEHAGTKLIQIAHDRDTWKEEEKVCILRCMFGAV